MAIQHGFHHQGHWRQPTGQILHWKLDEAANTGGTVDSSGSNDGTLAGATPNYPGKFGTAYNFDGVDDSVTKTLAANTTHSSFTLSIWAKARHLDMPDWNRFLQLWEYRRRFPVGQTSAGGYSGDVVGTHELGVADTNWTHFAVVCNGTDTTVFLNGDIVRHIPAKVDNVFQHYRLGMNRGQSTYFDGFVDEFRL